ncbi:helix-turn-helix transcriptional regulator [Pseudoalteromonas luteoviolacea]|uniref:HTH luxR-type domain-containing protein n=1 Tax=Pseudoalteromonas luteoviolacea S4060-1 TaxID=1365257 RepID=A0A161Y1I1_9GAMM|nr:helix-turn-helix transcriptional regulator [Pseudoalteromonas luteoviolacea]KZN60399.1 hypothetical protein N478_07520 [Pseudoalteromonas luteoviolacea S4060-1]
MNAVISTNMTTNNCTQIAFSNIVKKIDNIKTETDFRDLILELQTSSVSGFVGFIAFNHITPTSLESKVFGHLSSDIHQLLLRKEIQEHCNRDALPIALHQFGSLYPQNLFLLPVHAGHNEHGAILLHIDNPQEIEHLCWYWSPIATYLVRAYIKISKQRLKPITKREKDCLLWACEGKTSWEISQILGVSERTVNFHLANCIEKTNSANRLQAIAKCVVSNII